MESLGAAVSSGNVQCVGRDEVRDAGDGAYLALFGHHGQAGSQFVDYVLFVFAQCV